MKSKKTGIIIGAVFVIVISPFVVQYGWNEIVTPVKIWASQELDTSSEKLAEVAALFEV